MSSELDPEARQLLALAQAAERQIPRDGERVRQRVLAAVGGTALLSVVRPVAASAAQGVKAAGWAGGQVAVAGTGLGGVIKIVLIVSGLAFAGVTSYRLAVPRAVLRSATASATPTATVAQIAPQSGPVVRDAVARVPVASKPAGTADTQREGGVAAVAPVRARPARARDAESVPPPATAPAATVGPEPLTATNEASGTIPARDSLRADLRTLSAAQRALNAGAPAQALSLLRDLQGEQLTAERSALEVFAWCALGQVGAARQKAELFRSIAGDSPLLPRVNASCAKR